MGVAPTDGDDKRGEESERYIAIAQHIDCARARVSEARRAEVRQRRRRRRARIAAPATIAMLAKPRSDSGDGPKLGIA